MRRSRRRARRPSSAEDGYSTDSSLGEADAADYAEAQEVLQQRAKALSADVEAEDFRDPVVGIAQRFGGWRDKFEEEYSNAYGGLALVQAWEYWARGEMIGWEPTRVSLSPWFSHLLPS
jgi:GC-rich sequence DNA-binding factor